MATLKQRMNTAVKPSVEVMPITKAKPQLDDEAGKMNALAISLTASVNSLRITDAESYLEADGILARIRQARGVWGNIWERIQQRTIQPIRAGLEELYGLNRDVDKPMELLEGSVKAKMVAYKTEEARQLRAAEDARQLELERLQRIEDEARRKAENAKTDALRKQLTKAAEKAAAAIVESEQEQAPAPVRAAGSNVRTVPTPHVTNVLDFIQGIADGLIPTDVLVISETKLKLYFKDSPDDVKGWPGITVTDDVTIIGR